MLKIRSKFPKNMKESESRSVVSDSLWPHGLYSPWNSPGQNTGVGSLSLLQRIYPTQGSNPGLPLCRWILYQLGRKGNPNSLRWGINRLLYTDIPFLPSPLQYTATYRQSPTPAWGGGGPMHKFPQGPSGYCHSVRELWHAVSLPFVFHCWFRHGLKLSIIIKVSI